MAKNNSALLEALEIEIEECNDKLNRLGKMRELYLKDEDEKGPEPARRGRRARTESTARRPEGSADAADGQ